MNLLSRRRGRKLGALAAAAGLLAAVIVVLAFRRFQRKDIVS